MASTEIDTRLLGMVVALIAIWIAFHILSDGDFLTARNLWNLSVQSTSDRHHGDGDGAHHRVAEHRPLGRIAARLPRLHDGARPDRRHLRVLRTRRDRRRPAGQGRRLDRRARLRPPAGRPRSAPRRASSSPTSASPPSSSPWAASSSGGAPSSAWATSRARRSPRSTRRSSCSAAERKGSLGEWRSWLLALLACAAIVLSICLARRRRKRYEPRRCGRCGPTSGCASSAARP